MTMPLSSSNVLATRTAVVDPGFDVNDWLAGVVAGGALAEATLVLTELLGNAAKHASGPYSVTVVQRALVLRLEVRDESGAGSLPWVVGKGLLVVRGLFPEWGVVDHGGAKTVWAELPILMP